MSNLAENKLVASMGRGLIKNRTVLGIIFFIVTLMFGWSASQIRLDPGFLKLIPIKHEYMITMMDYMDEFSGANMILVNLRWKGSGDIYNRDFFDALEDTTQSVFFIEGIDRTRVKSLFTPDTYFIEVTEEGFKGEPVVPARYSGTDEQFKQIRSNVEASGQIGLLVQNDLKGALIRADLQEYDRSKSQEENKVDYWYVSSKLEDIRGKYESPKKYVYSMKEDQGPFKAGQVVYEGYVDYPGVRQYMQTFKVVYTPEGAESAESYDIAGGDVVVEEQENEFYNEDIEINIIGFSKLLGDVIYGLLGVFMFFGIAFVITIVLLYMYTSSVKITATAVVVAFLPVMWLIGCLPLLGLGIDPMSILVPFLIFSIGVSHAVQMTSAWRLEIVEGHSSEEASVQAFTKLFIPGAVALLTEALGFGVIMIIDIPIVKELGITACLGVLLMIITNKMILPIILSHMTLEQSAIESAAEGEKKDGIANFLWNKLAACAEPRNALFVFAFAGILMGIATWQSRHLVIGDSGVGVPELHQDSRYNIDSRTIADNYNIGVDLLTVMVEAPDFDGDSCLQYDVISLIDKFEMYVRGISGVQSVTSVAGIGKLIISAFNEGNPRWRALPRTADGIKTGSKAFDPGLGFNNDGCRAIQVLIFTKDHEGNTIAHIIKELKKFIAENQVDGVTLRLASGNVGVMAATNEAVGEAEVVMLSCLFGALVIFCLISFRSVTALLCVLVPLTAVCVMGNALMAILDIGLKVATLPVIALGVGVGVDYGIYIFERLQHYMADPEMGFREAFLKSMRDRGSAIVFTAATMSVGVATWTMSDLKYQADMGLLLAFLFLVNMLGAVALLPAMGSWFYKAKGRQ